MFIAGYDLPIGKYFSYWPRVSIGVHHVFDGGSALGQYDESTSVFADLDASFCWHPMPAYRTERRPGDDNSDRLCLGIRIRKRLH